MWKGNNFKEYLSYCFDKEQHTKKVENYNLFINRHFYEKYIG